MKQTTLGSTDWALKTKVTRRAQVPGRDGGGGAVAAAAGGDRAALSEGGAGPPPHPLPRMLRIYFMQQWFNLSDPAMEDALYDSESMRRFAGIDLTTDLVPDETTILRFRHLLEKHRLTEKLFAEVRQLLEEKKLLLKSGTIVDATIIAAPPSTKNAAQERDPEMKQTRKGKQWHFGMKLHVGTDRRGLVHSVVTGPASRGRHHPAGRPAAWAGAGDLRRPGVLVGRSSAALPPCRDRLPSQPPGQARPHADRAREGDQSFALASPRARRARVSCGEAPVGLHQGALPRAVQEHGARADDVRA